MEKEVFQFPPFGQVEANCNISKLLAESNFMSLFLHSNLSIRRSLRWLSRK